MRRLLRIAFAAFAGSSLLLCVAATGLWVRSYSAVDDVSATGDDGTLEFQCDTGRMTIFWLGLGHQGWAARLSYPWRYQRSSPGDDSFARVESLAEHWDVRFPGVGYTSGGDVPARFMVLVVHLAYPTVLFSLAPLAWLAGFRRQRRSARRARAGLCATCGYDLRASPGRCPECGSVVRP